MKNSYFSHIHKLLYFTCKSPTQSLNHNLFTTIFQFHTSPCNQLVQSRDPVAIANALKHSAKLNSLILGNQIHAHIIKLGFSNDLFSQNNLIVMYSKCGALECAYKVFDEMPERNLLSWTSVISGLIQNEECEMGAEVYLEMMRCGYRPNEFTLGSVLRGCASMKGVEFGWSVHCFALKVGLVTNNFVGCSVLYMYAKFGDIEAAEMAFESMDDRDVGCWNAMIGGYARNGYSLKALELVSIMHREGAVRDQFTFMSAIKGCVSFGDYCLGRQIHGMIIRSEVSFGSPGMNSLIDMYVKIGKTQYGLRVFGKLHNKDVISWNTVLGAFTQDGNAREAICTFSSMLYKGLKPNPITISHLFNLCRALLDLNLCLQLHSIVVRLGFLDEPAVANSLIDVFSRCGQYEMAESVFGSLTVTDITTWNEMLLGYKLNGCTGEAVKLFRNLRKSSLGANESTFSIILGTCCGGKHLEIGRQIHATIIRSGFDCQGFVCCSLINAYASFELFDDSFKVFSEIERLDLVSWGAMISAFVRGGCSYEALGLLNNLLEAGEKPDEFILGSILNGCANVTSYHQTTCIHSIAVRTGFEKHVCIASAVIDAYAKCGDVKGSRMVFDCSSRNDDVVLYNTMIMAYAHHGIVVEALIIFEQMKLINLQLTHATFVSVISLCSHLGLVELGCQLFDSINSDYKMLPSAENYGSFVDLFSRNGFLEDAKHVLEVMPFEPWPAVWQSFLNGCRIHGNKNLGEWASAHLLELVPKNDAAFMLLDKFIHKRVIGLLLRRWEGGCWNKEFRKLQGIAGWKSEIPLNFVYGVIAFELTVNMASPLMS